MLGGINFVYVFVFCNTDVAYGWKQIVAMAVAVVKAILLLIVIPKASQVVMALIPSSASVTTSAQRRRLQFRRRLSLSSFLVALNVVIFPISIVALADTRCVFYWWHEQSSATTTVSIRYCNHIENVNGRVTECLEYATNSVESSFTPPFTFDAEQCVSAVIETYSPVMMAYVLLTGIAVPAVQLVLPLCMEDPGWIMSYLVDVDLVWGLPEANGRPPMQVVEDLLETAYPQLITNLALVLTFGFAAPLVAAAAAFATLGSLLWHLEGLRERERLESENRQQMMKHLAGCERIPLGAVVAVLLPTLAVWALVLCSGFLEDSWVVVLIVACSALVSLMVLLNCSGLR